MSSIKSFDDWSGPIPTRCDLCGEKITDTFIDGKVHNASWAIMCRKCFDNVGSGLGPGQGQKYLKVIKEDNLKEGTSLRGFVNYLNKVGDI